MAKPEYLKRRLPWFRILAREWLSKDASKEKLPIRLETSLVRDVFCGLLAMASDSPYEDSDEVRILQVTEDVGFTDEQYCEILNLSREQWLVGKNRLRIRGTIEVDTKTNVIRVLNWGKYQTPYEHQRKSQLRHKRKLSTYGYKNYNEAYETIRGNMEVRKPNVDDIYATLKFLPKRWHESFHNALNKKFPEGHDWDKAHERYEMYLKQREKKDG